MIEEILISEVQERPCLWDHTIDIKMRGMNTVRKAWEEIGQVLSTYIYIFFFLTILQIFIYI